MVLKERAKKNEKAMYILKKLPVSVAITSFLGLALSYIIAYVTKEDFYGVLIFIGFDAVLLGLASNFVYGRGDASERESTSSKSHRLFIDHNRLMLTLVLSGVILMLIGWLIR